MLCVFRFILNTISYTFFFILKILTKKNYIYKKIPYESSFK